MIYLDTHILEAFGQQNLRRISKDALRMLHRESDIRVSPMVVLEIEFLREIGRTRVPAREIISRLGHDIGLRVCDRRFEDVANHAMAESWTRDVFDRIIVAQARLTNATLVTRDARIHQHYARAIA